MSEVYIDDVDASVTYSGDWRSSTDLRSHDNTLHFSNSVNSQASLTFTGISITVYGVVRAGETPQSSYTLDGGNPTVLQSTSGVISQYGVLLYTSPALQNGQHNLIITNLGNGSTFFIDYFAIVTAGAASTSSPAPNTINPSPTSSGSTRPGTTSSISSGTTSSPTPTSTSGSSSSSSSSSSTSLHSLRSFESGSSSSSDNVPPVITASSGDTDFSSAAGATSKNSRHIAAIIGSVAALSIVTAFIIAFLWLRRRRRRKKEFESWIINSFSGGTVVPTPTSFPTMTRQIGEELPPFPPQYAISEPPAYDANFAPVAQVIDSQRRFGRNGGFRKSAEKDSMVATQSSGDTPTSSNDRSHESN